MPRADRYNIDTLVEGLLAGDRRALARCLRLVDESPTAGRQIGAAVADVPSRAQILGITGNPGAGKSTVVNSLLKEIRQQGKKVAVLAIDPSSPFSGGAILGDRIRMIEHFSDEGVFIRSLATRGTLGGLSRSTFDSARVLEAAGFDVVLIETVGVGQDEVDVVRLAQTTVVVLVPGMGDDVQAIKAGLMEIADVFLLNKSDREGVNDLERGIRQMMSLVVEESGWDVPILRSVASQGVGIADAWSQIQAHQSFLQSEVGIQREARRREALFERLLQTALIESGLRQHAAVIAEARAKVAAGHDPYLLARGLG